jgi:chromosome segregation ATPase
MPIDTFGRYLPEVIGQRKKSTHSHALNNDIDQLKSSLTRLEKDVKKTIAENTKVNETIESLVQTVSNIQQAVSEAVKKEDYARNLESDSEFKNSLKSDVVKLSAFFNPSKANNIPAALESVTKRVDSLVEIGHKYHFGNASHPYLNFQNKFLRDVREGQGESDAATISQINRIDTELKSLISQHKLRIDSHERVLNKALILKPAPYGAYAAGNNRISGVAEPTQPSDAVNLNFMRQEINSKIKASALAVKKA